MRGIYDVKIKCVTLVSAAFISFLVFFAEVLWRGWDGLDWLEYPHYALVLPPLLFIFWLNYSYEFRLSAVKNLAFVAVYGTFFFAAYNSYPVAYNFLGYYGWVMLAGYMKYPWLQYLAWQLAVPFSLFCANSIIAFVFKLRLHRWEYLVLPFFPVPIYALSYVLLMLLAKTGLFLIRIGRAIRFISLRPARLSSAIWLSKAFLFCCIKDRLRTMRILK